MSLSKLCHDNVGLNMVIKKKVIGYERKKGTGVFTYRINVSLRDNLNEEVIILNLEEYEALQSEISELKNNRINNAEIKEKDKEISDLTLQLQNKNEQIANLEENKTKDHESIAYELKYANKLLDQQHETIKHDRDTMKEINQQHTDKLEQIYDKFNKELQKYVAVNHLQNNALKQILELGFIDIIRNKHKSIAKDQIKELTDDKKVYELAEKNN